MILADKITELRKKRGWSQKELAEKVDVTRQSVSKWESAQSTPDLDKILKLAEIFEVTTDELLKAEQRFEEEKPPEKNEKNEKKKICEKITHNAEERKVTAEEAQEFLEFKEKTAPKIAMGVSLCVLSPVLLILMAGAAEYRVINASEDRVAMLGVVILLAIVAAAVSIFFIPYGIASSKYEYIEKEPLRLNPELTETLNRQRDDYRSAFSRSIAIGVLISVLSVLPMFVAGFIFDPEDGFHFVVSAGILLVMISIAANIFVRAGIKWESYQKLLEEGDYTRAQKDKVLEAISSVYWLSVTAIYLIYSFINFNWHISWVIWPVAGVIFAIINVVYSAVKRD